MKYLREGGGALGGALIGGGGAYLSSRRGDDEGAEAFASRRLRNVLLGGVGGGLVGGGVAYGTRGGAKPASLPVPAAAEKVVAKSAPPNVPVPAAAERVVAKSAPPNVPVPAAAERVLAKSTPPNVPVPAAAERVVAKSAPPNVPVPAAAERVLAKSTPPNVPVPAAAERVVERASTPTVSDRLRHATPEEYQAVNLESYVNSDARLRAIASDRRAQLEADERVRLGLSRLSDTDLLAQYETVPFNVLKGGAMRREMRNRGIRPAHELREGQISPPSFSPSSPNLFNENPSSPSSLSALRAESRRLLLDEAARMHTAGEVLTPAMEKNVARAAFEEARLRRPGLTRRQFMRGQSQVDSLTTAQREARGAVQAAKGARQEPTAEDLHRAGYIGDKDLMVNNNVNAGGVAQKRLRRRRDHWALNYEPAPSYNADMNAVRQMEQRNNLDAMGPVSLLRFAEQNAQYPRARALGLNHARKRILAATSNDYDMLDALDVSKAPKALRDAVRARSAELLNRNKVQINSFDLDQLRELDKLPQNSARRAAIRDSINDKGELF